MPVAFGFSRKSGEVAEVAGGRLGEPDRVTGERVLVEPEVGHDLDGKRKWMTLENEGVPVGQSKREAQA